MGAVRGLSVWWLPVAASIATLAGVLVGLWAGTLGASAFLASHVTQALVFPWVGAAIVRRYRRHLIGWLFCLIGVGHAVAVVAGQYAAIGMAHDAFGWVAALWLESWAWFVGLAPLATSVLLRLPDGELLSRRWRPVEVVLMVVQVAVVVGLMLQPGMLVGDQVVVNPVGVEAAEPLVGVLLAVLALGAVVSAGSFVIRVRRAAGERRRQLAPVVASAVLIGVGLMVGVVVGTVEPIIHAVVLPTLPLATAVSVFRFRLYDVEPVLRRSATYLVLVAGLALLYVVAVSVLGLMMRGEPGTVGSVVAAALVVAAVAPVHDAVRRTVARWLFGERDDPGAVLARLGRRLDGTTSPEAVLGELVETASDALRLRRVAVEIGGETVVSTGTLDGDVERFGLPHDRVEVGELVAAGRTPGEPLSRVDRQLLDDLARHAGAVAAAARAAEAVRRSREQLLTAHEDERRRVRRDLHDGLGPTLAALAVQLDALDGQLESSEGATHVRQLWGMVDGAIGDLRRTVRGLRPLALDELGLRAALEELAARVSDPAGLKVELRCDGDLDRLPTDVEVATFRVVQEAVTNVVRHSNARTCRVTIRTDRDVHIEVCDDGLGFDPDRTEGEGTVSMRERVEALAGDFAISSGPDRGARVLARLPVDGR